MKPKPNNQLPERPSPRRSKAPVLLAVLFILLAVVLWHLVAPFLGITFALTGTIWGAVVSTIVVLCVSMVLFFIFSGIGILIIGMLAVIWTIAAIILFPILFPLLAPIVILLMLIGFLFGRRS